MLKALVASDFIQPYVPFGISKHDEYYKLTDPFCLFYQKFVEGSTEIDPSFWIHNVTSQGVSSWRGFAFEEVCMAHVRQRVHQILITSFGLKYNEHSGIFQHVITIDQLF